MSYTNHVMKNKIPRKDKYVMLTYHKYNDDGNIIQFMTFQIF